MRNGVVWQPLPGSQTLALSCPASQILYDGSRGPGKTDAQLMRFRMRVGIGYGNFWRGIIFDREYKNLDDLVAKSMRWFPLFKDGAKFLASKSDYRWVWPTGEELLFRAIKKDSDYWGYHGQEFPFIGWNELTKYPTPHLYEAMMSCNRSSFVPENYPVMDKDGESHLLPPIPLEVFATTNPFGAGHNWVKEKFISNKKPGHIYKEIVPNVFNPQTQEVEDVAITRTRIFGSYKENKYLSPIYVANLEKMTDLNKKKAWLGGSWDIVSGGMFDDVWDERTNWIMPFDIPTSWKIDRSYDHGESRPFSVGWWAKSDGSDVLLPDGSWMSTIKGDLFRIAEWYGTSGKENEGLRLTPEAIAEGIIEREIAMGLYRKVAPGPADNSIWDGLSGKSVAALMAKSVRVGDKVYPGVQWARSNKNPGSRKAGWSAMRQMLNNVHPKDKEGNPLPRRLPGMFIFNTCSYFKKLVPVLPRDETDPDDVDTDAEDHNGDEARYRVLHEGWITTSGTTHGT